MSSRLSYTYTTLRYVHDVAAGEFLNIGVALYCPEKQFVSVQCRSTYKRLKDVFPTLSGDAYRASVRHVNTQFERINDRIHSGFDFEKHQSVLDFAHSVLRPDDSTLQWSPVGSGLTEDPEVTLENLYDRFVSRYDHKSAPSRKYDDDVWRHFSKELEKRHVLKHFSRKTIEVQDDQLDFEHAWKNGKWHCLAPVSFDLASEDSIRNKARLWLGQLASVKSSSDEFKTYFLVGAPKSPELQDAFNSALSILGKTSVPNEIVKEIDASDLADHIASDIAKDHIGL